MSAEERPASVPLSISGADPMRALLASRAAAEAVCTPPSSDDPPTDAEAATEPSAEAA